MGESTFVDTFENINKKQLLIISDSLGLPREEPERTIFEDTYPYLLRFKFEVAQLSLGGGTITDLVRQAYYYKGFCPDIVILNAGIVDCVPRAYTSEEEFLFSHFSLFGLVRIFLSKTITTRRIRRIRKKRYTGIVEFEMKCLELKAIFGESLVYAVQIVAQDEIDSVNPGALTNISEYNDILEKVFGENFITFQSFPNDALMTDFHHLNRKGHSIFASSIESAILKENVRH